MRRKPLSQRVAAWQLVPVAIGAAMPCVVILGIALGSPSLQSFTADHRPMVRNTALGLLLSALALVLAMYGRARVAMGVLAAAVLAIGGLTLAEYAFGVDLGIDGLLGTERASAGLAAGRTAANTAVCFVLLGASLLALGRGRGPVRPAEAGALAIGLVSLMALLGHLLGVSALQRGSASPLRPMALPTALALLALATGLVVARPEGGLLGLIRADTPGGALVRRLAPAAIVVPIVLAYLRLEGQRAGLYGTAAGVALYCGLLIVVLLGLIAVTAIRLDRVEGARRASRAREQAIVEATVDGVITLDAEGRIREFNAAAERMFGRARADVIGQALAPLVIPEGDRAAHERGLQRAVSGGAPTLLGRPVELTALRADGTSFPVEVTISRLAGEGPEWFVGHVRDVSARREAEHAERTLTALVESSADPIIAAGLDNVVTSWNPAAERVYGYTSREAIGRPLPELILPPELRGKVGSRQAELERDGSVTLEDVHMRRDGSRFDGEATLSITRDGAGRPAGLSLICRDVTQRRESERAIQRFAAIVDSSPDAIMMFNLDGTILVWNDAGEHVYGFTAEDMLGAGMSKLVGGRSRPLAGLYARIREGEVVSQEGVAQHKGGHQVDVFYTMFPIRDESGATVAGGLIGRDVTERRKLESQLRQAQKMEAVGQLAGGVAHDFNNLLTVITGFGDLARSLVGSGPGAEELEEIERAAQRASALTNQLLAFSRRQLLNPVALDLGEVARGLVPMLERLIGEHIAVRVRTDLRLPQAIADRGQVEQVIVNLAINARDAMPDGGTLTIEAHVRELDEEEGLTSYVCLSVSDTGVGIDDEALPHVFEPFYTTKAVGEGTGLGLAMVHGAVSQSGGHVRVYSERGIGTSFKVYLPVADAPAPAPVTLLSPDADGFRGRETLLLCEDEDSVRALLERVLARAGYRVLSAARPLEALEHARAEPDQIDGLISDVIMPDMPGPELARQLQELRPGLRTLFVSGYTADTINGLPTGSAFLEKPFNHTALLRTVRELLDREPVPPG